MKMTGFRSSLLGVDQLARFLSVFRTETGIEIRQMQSRPLVAG